MVDGDDMFDTTARNGNGPMRTYSIAETGGCNAEQIATTMDLGNGHWKYGVSIGAMDEWVAQVSTP